MADGDSFSTLGPIWDECIWREDDIGYIYKLAKESVEAIHDYTNRLPDGDIDKDGGAAVKQKADCKKKWQKHASASESTARLKAMVENLKTEYNIPVLMEDMDLNGLILPVLNGTIDLKTCELRESRRVDLCTKLANVTYDKSAKCPVWDKFLNEPLPVQDTKRYMQELIGYCLTGETKEEQIYILYGTGSNGKNTFTDAISSLVGDFGINVKASTLLTSDNKQSTPDNEIVMLKGVRTATASDPKKGIRLGEDVIKAITNAKSMITGRRLYQEQTSFYPSHKVLLSTNHKPGVADQSRGMRRRLRLIPFTTIINEEERDRDLGNKLEKELSGILNWAIEGCRSWQEAGYLKMSDEVERETDGYIADNDRVTEFLNTVTTKGSKKDMIPNEWLRNSYNTWAESRGFGPNNDKTFHNAMVERDYFSEKRDGRVQWFGLKLIITKIYDIHKKYPLAKYKKLMEQVQEIKQITENEEIGRGLVEVSRGLVDHKTLSSEDVDHFLKTLAILKNNNDNGIDIDSIEKLFCEITSTTSLDSETTSTKPLQPHLIAKKENNNGNGSCDGANAEESVNDEPGEITLEIKRLSRKDKDVILDKMRVHFEGSTGEKLTAGNLKQFGRFVKKEHDRYSIHDAMVDANNKFNLVVSS